MSPELSLFFKLVPSVIRPATRLLSKVNRYILKKKKLRGERFDAIDECLDSAYGMLLKPNKIISLDSILKCIPQAIMLEKHFTSAYVQDWLKDESVEEALKELAINVQIGFFDQNDLIEFVISKFEVESGADVRSSTYLVEGIVNYLAGELDERSEELCLESLKHCYLKLQNVEEAVTEGFHKQNAKIEKLNKDVNVYGGVAEKTFEKVEQLVELKAEEKSNNLRLDELRRYKEQIQLAPQTTLSLLLDFKEKYFSQSDSDLNFKMLFYIGNCYQELGEREKAKEFLSKSTGYASTQGKALQVESIACLIHGDAKQARSKAQLACKADPNDPYNFALLLRSSVTESSVDFETIIPERYHTDINCLYELSKAYRGIGKYEKAIYWAKKAYKLSQDNLTICGHYGTVLLASLTNDPHVRIDHQFSLEVVSQLEEVRTLLEKVWLQAVGTEAVISQSYVGCNLVTLYEMLNRENDREEVLRELERFEKYDVAITKLLVHEGLSNGEIDSVRSRIKNCSTPDVDLQLTEVEILIVEEKYEEAQQLLPSIIIEQKNSQPSKMHAYFSIILAYELSGIDAMRVQLNQFVDLYGDDPFFNLLAAKVLLNYDLVSMGKNILLKVYESALEGYSCGITELASLLYSLKEYRKVVNVCSGVVCFCNDSDLLRLYLSSLLALEKLKELNERLEEISADLMSSKFYSRIKILYLYRTGDVEAASSNIETFVGLFGEDLELRLLWIEAKKNLERYPAIRKFLRNSPPFLDEDPLLRFRLALYQVNYDFEEKAFKTAYAAYFAGQYLIEVKEAYWFFFLTATQDKILPSQNKVVPNSVVTYKDEFGEEDEIVVYDEELQSLLKRAEEYKTTSVGLLNKKIGDSFLLETSSGIEKSVLI